MKQANLDQRENRVSRVSLAGMDQQEEVAAPERKEEWVLKGHLALQVKLELQELLECLELREDLVLLETGVDQDLLDYKERKVKKAPRARLVNLALLDLQAGVENGVQLEQMGHRDLVAQ